MRQFLSYFLFAALLLSVCVSSIYAEFVLPKDGMFYVESKPAVTFKATLTDYWTSSNTGKGILYVFAPMLPEYDGQKRVSSDLQVSGSNKIIAEEITEYGICKRPMLMLQIDSNELPPQSGIPLLLKYKGILYARTLKRGKSPKIVPQLTETEQRQYLMGSTTMDFNDPQFLQCMNDQGLKRRGDEDTMQFAYRVFTHFIGNGKYGGNTTCYEVRRPSYVCKSLTSDCGGLALLFVAVMRANNVPARTLFGRWAIPQTDEYGQYHVTAEFFVEKSGWVPVDISGMIVHKPKDPNAFFGNTDGRFIAFHIDTDLEPAKGLRHAWAQYLLLRWSGNGDFWKEHRVDSKWDVQCRFLTERYRKN
jgi:hypothetical protein